MTTTETPSKRTLLDRSRPTRELVPEKAAPPTTRSYWATLMVIGVIGGILSGLFAIGGAILMVPLLVWRAGMDQRRAAATSLVAITPTAIVSSLTYLAHGDVNVVVAAVVAAGAVAGALLGSRLLHRLPLAWLRWMFIAFVLVVAAHMLLVAPNAATCWC